MTVSSASPTPSSDLFSTLGIAQQQPKRATSGNDLGMDSFLTLMTQQMKNQDPTKPMDSSQFLGQLAQFASVKGLQQLDTRLSGMTTMMGEDQSLQAADLVGKNAYIKSNTGELVGTNGISGRVTTKAAGDVTVDVTDASGNVVRELDVPSSAAGDVDFKWDGTDAKGNPMPPGTYTFTAKSGSTTLDMQIAARINSISYTPNGVVINLDGHDGITFDQILSLD